jgi:hypothetical protein
MRMLCREGRKVEVFDEERTREEERFLFRF